MGPFVLSMGHRALFLGQAGDRTGEGGCGSAPACGLGCGDPRDEPVARTRRRGPDRGHIQRSRLAAHRQRGRFPTAQRDGLFAPGTRGAQSAPGYRDELGHRAPEVDGPGRGGYRAALGD